MVHGDVGVRCKSCAGDGVGKPLASGGKKVVGLGVLVLVGLIAVGSLGRSVLGSSDTKPGLNLPQITSTTTAEQLVDPWTPDDPSTKLRVGYRFVAVELIVQNDASSEGKAWWDPEDYTLSDSDNFKYGTVYGGAEPHLPSISLNPGQKSRGWITFEIPVESHVVSLDDYKDNIPLPK
jgi:hypothetical protein